MHAGGRLAAIAGAGGRMTTLAIEPKLERYALVATDEGHAAIWALDGSVRRLAALALPGGTYVAAGEFLPAFGSDGPAPVPEDLQVWSLLACGSAGGLLWIVCVRGLLNGACVGAWHLAWAG